MATVDRTREARVREDPEDQAVRAAREAKAKEKAKEDQAVREAKERAKEARGKSGAAKAGAHPRTAPRSAGVRACAFRPRLAASRLGLSWRGLPLSCPVVAVVMRHPSVKPAATSPRTGGKSERARMVIFEPY